MRGAGMRGRIACGGGGKSGSPTARESTGTPWRLREQQANGPTKVQEDERIGRKCTAHQSNAHAR
eukprot:6209947-Pleurochrysis_carterae.AAC.2